MTGMEALRVLAGAAVVWLLAIFVITWLMQGRD